MSEWGPMHGERTRRHQVDVGGPGNPVLSVYEHQVNEEPRLAIELTAASPSGLKNVRADLALADVERVREWLAEFIVAWDPDS